MIWPRDDTFEPHYRARILLRAAFWSAIILFTTCLAINIVSLFGYDLTQMTHFPASDTADPVAVFLVPITAAFFILLIPVVFHQMRNRERLQQDFRVVPWWMKAGGGALWIYVLAIMIYMAIVFHYGGPQIHNGAEVIWLKGEGKYEQVSPAVYHRAVAVTVLFVSAWGMLAFGGFAAVYWGWFQNATANRIANG